MILGSGGVLLWNMVTRPLADGHRRFGRTCCLHLISWRLSKEVPPKRRYPSTKLHGVTSYNIEILTIIRSQSECSDISKQITIVRNLVFLFCFFHWLYSPCGPWPLFSFLVYSQLLGLLGRVISPSQGRYLNTGQHKHRINTYTTH
jgi:hypothetical protein